MIPGRSYLFTTPHIPVKARFPVIDAHNHLWGRWDKISDIKKVMASTGVISYVDLTANLNLRWVDDGYSYSPCDIDQFFKAAVSAYPGQFIAFTTWNIAPSGKVLFSGDIDDFIAEGIGLLRDHREKGVRGGKILKELGLHYKDRKGNLLFIDDPRLQPFWDEAVSLGIPVLAHQSDPYGFFKPVVPENEHYESLKKFSSWSFADSSFPTKETILEHRDSWIRNNPELTIILPHVGNFAENLSYVGGLLDECANVYIDISARLDELGRQPYTSREFFMQYQNRILFGTDMPPSEEMYRCYFRFLETYDEYFFPPDYDGSFDRSRWYISGIGLPDRVLKKIYFQNALKIIPGLKEELHTLIERRL